MCLRLIILWLGASTISLHPVWIIHLLVTAFCSPCDCAHNECLPGSHNMTSNTTVALRKWDGEAKEASLWKGFAVDKGCWASNANCLVFLSREAEEHGNWSIRINFEDLVTSKSKPLLLQLKTKSTSNERCSSLESNAFVQPNFKLPQPKCWLCLAPPEHYNAVEKEQFNITTRNFFAWMAGKPLVGPDPALALLGVKYRMDIWRSPGQDNFSSIYQYAKKQGYGDLGDIQSVLARRIKGDYKLPTRYKLEATDKGPANVTFFGSASSRPLLLSDELDISTSWIQNLSREAYSLPPLPKIPQLPPLTLAAFSGQLQDALRTGSFPSDRQKSFQKRHAGFSAPPSAIVEDKQAEHFWQTHQASMHRAVQTKFPNTSAQSLPEQMARDIPMMSGALASSDIPALPRMTSLQKKRQTMPAPFTFNTFVTPPPSQAASASNDHAISGLLRQEVRHKRKDMDIAPPILMKNPSRNTSSTSLGQSRTNSLTSVVHRPQSIPSSTTSVPTPKVCDCLPEQNKKTKPLPERPLPLIPNFDPGIVFTTGRKKQLLQALEAQISVDIIPPKTPPTRFRSLRLTRRAKSTKSVKEDVDKRNIRRSQIVSVEILPDSNRPGSSRESDGNSDSKRSSQISESAGTGVTISDVSALSANDTSHKSSYLRHNSSIESLKVESEFRVPIPMKMKTGRTIVAMKLDGTQLMDKLLADLHDLG